MRMLSRIIFVAMLAMAVIIIPLGVATIIMAIELGLFFEALSGMLMTASLSAGSIWLLPHTISRSRPVSARRTMSISILLWMSFWNCAESWIAASYGICCKAKRKTAIIRRYTSALAAHLPKSLEPSVGQDRTKKAFPVWRN